MANSALQVNSTLLGGKYRIESILGQGGFGITYLAVHTILGKKVAIKEFFPKEYCDRESETSHITLGTQTNSEFVTKLRNKFIKEAQNISKLSHANIIQIQDIFEENNTAYYVMEYIEGNSLEEIVTKQGSISVEKAFGYIRKIADALRHMHGSHMMHLDVKPANIMIRTKDDSPILIDFGLSKAYTATGGQTSTTPHGVSHGYSPLEQYNADGVSKFSPQTDIYSFGATFFKIITGTTPPDATKRLEQPLVFPDNISESLRKFINSCMAMTKTSRPQDMQAVLSMMDSCTLQAPEEKIKQNIPNPPEVEEITDESEDDSKTKIATTGGGGGTPRKPASGKTPNKKKGGAGLWIAIAIVVALAAGAGIYFMLAGKGKSSTTPVDTTEVVPDESETVITTEMESTDTLTVAAPVNEDAAKAEPAKTDTKKSEPAKTDTKKEAKKQEPAQERTTAADKTSAVRAAAAKIGRSNMEAGMWVTGASVSGNALVFSVSCDRNVYDAEDFSNTSHFSSAMRAYVSTSSAASSAISQAKAAGMTVRFYFSGAGSKYLTY